MKEDKITVMIVDDDIKSQQVLEYHLRSIPGIEILSIASSADEAYSFLLLEVPDLIFLDVEMPGKTGFDLVAQIRRLGINPCIVFQTAFDKYAIQAIKNAAFDYLLKPIDKEELLESLIKFKYSKLHHNLEEQVENLIHYIKPTEKIRFNARAGFIMIDPNDIIYCHADWNYTEIWLIKDKKEVVTMNLGNVEKLLPEILFAKISRSLLINRAYIVRFNRKTRMIYLNHNDSHIQFKVASSQINAIKEY